MSKTPAGPRSAALAVGAGIALSRVIGLVRERVFAHYLGNSELAGAFKAALRIPNLLQNLAGEGVLSASFIPVYSRLRAEGREDEARQVAGVVFTALLLFVASSVALMLVFAPTLTDLIAPGFEGEVRTLTTRLVRIVCPGVGVLVLSAWCLGVLNSHGRFFLSYAAPVLWNTAQIAALLMVGAGLWGASGREVDFALAVAWGTVAGAGLQFIVQLGPTLRLLRGLRPSLTPTPPAKQVFTSVVPVIVARGVVQISAYVDQILASFIGPLAVAAISYAQQLYMLPISLFGVAISAASLPELSALAGDSQQAALALRERLASERLRMAFFVIPSLVAFLAIGDAIVALLYQSGRFGADDTRLVWTILAGSSLGLFAATRARLLASAFYALGDTRAPLRFALLRVLLGTLLGWTVVQPLRHDFGWPPDMAAAGLTASASAAAWLEFLLMSRALALRIGSLPSGWRREAPIWGCALAAGGAGFGARRALAIEQPIVDGLVTVALFGSVYLFLAIAAGVGPARALLRRLRR
jgi:putative peptidoglycan lipid II flippase